MAKTATGLPYPVPTDPVAAGADAIRALAEGVEKHIQSGTVAATGNNTASMTVNVTFPVAFASAPIVVVSTSNWNHLAAPQPAPTATGASFQTGRRDAANWTNTINIYWVAIGVIP